MKKLTLILALAILLAGGAVATMSAPAQAQYGYDYPPRLRILTRSLGSGLIRRGSISTVIGLYRDCCIIFSALNTAGPRITRILPPILKDPLTGMSRSGKRGISETLITGRVFSGRIPTGAATGKVSVITRVSMKRIIAARDLGGRKDSVASPLKNNPSQ